MHMSSKILVIHTSGMVGKSTVTASVLYPNLGPNVEVISVESLNQDASRYGIPVTKMRASEWERIHTRILLSPESLIADVGASSFVAFRQALQEHPGAMLAFDAVVVVTTPDVRVQQESITTIEALAAVGMLPEQLRVVYNRATNDRDFDIEFEHVLAYLNAKGDYSIHPAAIVYESTVYTQLASEGTTLQAMLSDSTDYPKLIREESTRNKAANRHHETSEAMRLARLYSLKMKCQGVAQHLQEAFSALRLPAKEEV